MKQLFILLFIISAYFTVAIKSAEAQSIKGRAWQSQDNSTITIKPKTIVINSDATFHQIDFFYLNANTIHPTQAKQIVGTIKLNENNLTLTSIVDGKTSKEWFYKLKWKNEDEFLLIDGNKTYSFAALGSNADIFSKNFIIPYLEKAISKNEKYNFCYKKLIATLSVDTATLKEEYKFRREASETKKVNPEKYYRLPDGKTFTHQSTNGIIVIDFKTEKSYNLKYTFSEGDCTSGFEESGEYTSNEDIIHFTRKTLTERDCNVWRTNNNKTDYHKNVVWVNDFNFRMKLGNMTYLFTAKQ